MEQFKSRPSRIESIMDDDTEQLLSIGQKRLREDGINLADLNLPGEKLDYVKEQIVFLASVMAKITPEYFRKNRDEFSEISELAEKDMLIVEAMLIDLEAKVETDYSPPTFWTQFWTFVFAPISPRANMLRTGIKKIKHRRKAFMNARQEYQEIIDSHRRKIYNIVHADLIQEQQMILVADRIYQDKKKKLIHYEAVDGASFTIEKLQEEISLIERQSLILAKEKLNNPFRSGGDRKK